MIALAGIVLGVGTGLVIGIWLVIMAVNYVIGRGLNL
jgi:hypothetical protein